MATLKYALAALRVINDRDTNTTSYIDVVDGFTVNALPAAVPPFSIASLWEQGGTAGQLDIRVDLVGPDGQALLPPFQVPTQQITAGTHHRVNLNLAGILFPQAGRYYARIEERRGGEWAEAARVTLDIKYVAPRPNFVIEQAKGTRVPSPQ